ncbi:MAG TPA: FAD-dependent oxidoreductase [Myxococcota bacterium]|nr:FAD-dependent oxidoreductase [Myxococcota bacterium]
MNASNTRPLLVVGGGIAGVTCALEAAEADQEVILIEEQAYIGGRVVRNYQYFPKLCPPTCGMEINIQRIENNARVRVLTSTRVSRAVRGDDGWKVTLVRAPQYINEHCTACGECSNVCKAKVKDPFNVSMGEVPAVRLPHPAAWPQRFVLDRDACSAEDLEAIENACQYGAVDIEATESEEIIEVGAVVLASGWKPYPLEKLVHLGGGKIANVIANVHMERLAAPAGPTGGKILRPSDGKAPASVAFVQCAGSRDVNHLPYCSAVCCLASLKQALYVKDQLPECEVSIYYIDRRAPGRNEDFLTRVAATEGIRLVKGKVGKIEGKQDGSATLRLEDVEAGQILEAGADLVVLATGMVPNLENGSPFDPLRDPDGFGLDDPGRAVFVAGVARRPEDVAASVRDATGAAAKASVAAGRRA